MLGKNANHEGSVYREANGRWCATYWLPGEKRPRKTTGKTREQAIERREKRRRSAGLELGDLRTVGQLAEWWLEHVHRGKVRDSSWAKAADRVERIKRTLGSVSVVDLDYRTVVEWQARIGKEPSKRTGRPLAARTVRLHRQALAQIIDEAVKLGAITGNPVRTVDPPAVNEAPLVALDRRQVVDLLGLAGDHRLGAAVVMLFMQGWRISEVLGLAWEDIDLDAGTVRVRRASVYVDGQGQQLGPTKTSSTAGETWLMPTVVEALRAHRDRQAQERHAAPHWETIVYEGEHLTMVFTTPIGGLVLRQTVAKIIKQAAITVGITADISTHTGRRSVITSLWAEGGEAIEDIAKYVGHTDPNSTRAYVKRLGRRPEQVARRAADVLDPQSSESPSDGGSNVGSDDDEPDDRTVNGPERIRRSGD